MLKNIENYKIINFHKFVTISQICNNLFAFYFLLVYDIYIFIMVHSFVLLCIVFVQINYIQIEPL